MGTRQISKKGCSIHSAQSLSALKPVLFLAYHFILMKFVYFTPIDMVVTILGDFHFITLFVYSKWILEPVGVDVF